MRHHQIRGFRQQVAEIVGAGMLIFQRVSIDGTCQAQLLPSVHTGAALRMLH
jgi:hypothetical protein